MNDRTRRILISSIAGLAGVGIAAAIAMLLIVPTLRNTCTLLTGQCVKYTYKRLASGQILLSDHIHGVSYWYDGSFIRSYGVKLPGECPPLQGQGIPVLEPSFVVNAHTMLPSRDGIVCSKSRQVVEGSFVGIKDQQIKMHTKGKTAPDAVEIFNMLKLKGVFAPPVTNPESDACNGNGKVVGSVCVCDSGFVGTRCGTKVCISTDECGNGVCNGGLCTCDKGWTGDSCDLRACDKCVNGVCDDGTCVCTPGFDGDACDQRACDQVCENGICDITSGLCKCDPEWRGSACDEKKCPANCSGNGMCGADGVCECNHGWKGDSCNTTVCVDDCNMNGVCNLDEERCECDLGWTGSACATSVCPKSCCTHGKCDPELGVCECTSGWSGDDCSIPSDPLGVSEADMCPDGDVEFVSSIKHDLSESGYMVLS